MKKEQAGSRQNPQDPTAAIVELSQAMQRVAESLGAEMQEWDGPARHPEINPVMAMNELRELILPYDWAWAAIRSQETPGEMERVFRNMFTETWFAFINKSERIKIQDYEPGEPRSAAMFQFIEHYIACLDVVNWTMFFDRIKGIKRQYSMTEVTEILGLTRQTIATYIDKGLIQAAKYGRSWRFPAEGIEQYLSQAERKKRRLNEGKTHKGPDPRAGDH